LIFSAPPSAFSLRSAALKSKGEFEMKYILLLCSALISAPLAAQSASSNSGSTSGANSSSGAQVGSNVQATGQSASVSQAGADSTSAAGALGNIVEVNQDFSTPSEQTINTNINANSTATNIQRYEGEYSVKTTASVVSPSISPSAVCMGSVSGGAGFVGFGISGGKTIRDDKCDKRESARLLGQLGMTAGAVSLLCTEPDIAKAMPGQCMEAQIAVGLLPPRPELKPTPAPRPELKPVPPAETLPAQIEYKSSPVVQPLPAEPADVGERG
jgi:hypothetical protein